MIHFSFPFLVVAGAFLAVPALASPFKTVGSAVVNKGAHTVEVRSGFSVDDTSHSQDGRLQIRGLYDYGSLILMPCV